jgi:hypothetical protein
MTKRLSILLFRHLDWLFVLSAFLLIAIASVSPTCAHSDDGVAGLGGLVSWSHFKRCGACRNLLQTVLQLQLPSASDTSAPPGPSFLPVLSQGPMLSALPPLPKIPMLSTLPMIPIIPTPPVLTSRNTLSSLPNIRSVPNKSSHPRKSSLSTQSSLSHYRSGLRSVKM